MSGARAKLVSSIVLASSLVLFVAFVALVIADAYVRWKINQEFSFLGDFGLLSIALAFALPLSALVFSARASQ